MDKTPEELMGIAAAQQMDPDYVIKKAYRMADWPSWEVMNAYYHPDSENVPLLDKPIKQKLEKWIDGVKVEGKPVVLASLQNEPPTGLLHLSKYYEVNTDFDYVKKIKGLKLSVPSYTELFHHMTCERGCL